MPRNQIIDSDDDENEPEDLPPPQKTSRNPRKDLPNNIQLPKRTRVASERTLSAKQQAISKYSHHPIIIGWRTCLPLDDNNNELLQMKVARLEKENMKLKRKGLKKKGSYFLTCISVAEIFKDLNSGNENPDDDEPESEEPMEDSNAQFPSSVSTSYHFKSVSSSYLDI